MINHLIKKFVNSSLSVKGVYHLKIPAGSEGVQESAPCAGFIFPIRGKAEYKFNDNRYIAKPGYIIHGGANMHLEKKVLGEQPWEFITILYNANTLNSEVQLSEMDFQIKLGINPKIEELLWRIWRSYNEPGELAKFEIEAIFRLIILEIFQSYQERETHDDFGLYERIVSYIHIHYMENLSVSELAHLHGINENKLFYVFNKFANMGAGDYLKVYRLNRAKELLLRGHMSIKEIAYYVGYNDPLYFSRMFKKHNNITPSKFIRQFRNNP